MSPHDLIRAALVVLLVGSSCKPTRIDVNVMGDRCGTGNTKYCTRLITQCEAGALSACEQAVRAFDRRDPQLAARMAWYWCARAKLDGNAHAQVAGCSRLAHMHETGMGTPADAYAATALYAETCALEAASTETCLTAARLGIKTHSDRATIDASLRNAYEKRPWETVDAVSQLWIEIGDIESAVDVLRRTCRGARKESCDELARMDRLTDTDIAMYEEAVAEQLRREEEERLEREQEREEERQRQAERAAQEEADHERRKQMIADAYNQAMQNNAAVQEKLDNMHREISAIQRQSELESQRRASRKSGSSSVASAPKYTPPPRVAPPRPRYVPPIGSPSTGATTYTRPSRSSVAASAAANARPAEDSSDRARQKYLGCVQTNHTCNYGTSAACKPAAPPTGPFAQGSGFGHALMKAESCTGNWNACYREISASMPQKSERQRMGKRLRELVDRYYRVPTKHRGSCDLSAISKLGDLEATLWLGNGSKENFVAALRTVIDGLRAGDALHTCVYYGEFAAERERIARARIDQCSQWSGYTPPASEIERHMRSPPAPNPAQNGPPEAPPPPFR